MRNQDESYSGSTLNRVIFILIIGAIGLSLLFYLLPFRFFQKPLEPIQKVYYADNISAAHQLMINAFNEKYKGEIEVIPINLPFTKFTTNERKELIARSLRSKNSRIDVFAVDQIWVPRFARWALPLNEYFNDLTVQGIKKEIISTCYYDQKLVALPLYMDVGVLYFRHDLLSNLPEYETIVSKLKRSISWKELNQIRDNYFADEEFYLFQADNYEGLICNYLEFLSNHNGVLAENGHFTINTPEAQLVCKEMKDLIYESKMSPSEVLTFNENESYAYSIENDVPFFRAWPSMIVNTEIIPATQINKLMFLDIASLPHEEGQNPKTVFGGWNLMISQDTENKDAAVKFIDFCLSHDIQKLMFEIGGYLPVLQSVYADSNTVMNFERLKYLETLIPNGIHRPQHPDYTRVSDILSLALNRILANEVTIEEGLSKAEKDIHAIVSD
ncbi:MAG: extracellular solute-binding protein [Candidatus Marinimicrobia bacterium]|nr:extracellular solute-binding protein [Candidatus Neomarinimicrobiota bacterium]